MRTGARDAGAAIHLLAYLALGASAIVAGSIVGDVGVTAMAIGFGTAIAIVSLLGIVTTAARPHPIQRAAAS